MKERQAKGRRPRGTGADYVYDTLKARILELELEPGTLLEETELSRQFGVSRSPVREALIRLAAEGLVFSPRNRTPLVAPFDVAALPAYFDALQLLYRLSARLAAANPDKSRAAALHANLKANEHALASGDMKEMIRLNREFHAGVAEMGGNPFIASWMRGLLDQGQRLLRLYGRHLKDKVPVAALKAHRDMLAAIEKGDAAGAEEAGRTDSQVIVGQLTRIMTERPAALLLLDPR